MEVLRVRHQRTRRALNHCNRPSPPPRKSASEEAIRQLKYDLNMNHAPVQDFFGNRVWWLSGALAYNVARWLRVLALPEPSATCRGKRLRTSFLNVPDK